MNEEKLIWGAGFIDDDLVCEAIDYKPRRIRLAPWACAAAAAVVLVTALAVFSRFGGNSTVLPPDSSGIGTSAGLPEYTAGKENSSTPNDQSDYSTPPNNSTDTSVSTATTGDIDDPTPPERENGWLAYADIFEDFIPENPTTYGPELTLEEVMNALKPNPDYPEYDLDSFYTVEVIRALSNEEYKQLKGWKEFDGGNGDTIYEVILVEDLINGRCPESTVYLQIPAGHGASIQLRGDPAYAPGEMFTAAISKPYEGHDFVMSVCDHKFRYDLPDAKFTKDDTKTMLYYRGKGQARVPFTDFPFRVTELNVSTSYSTPQNPVTYIQSIPLDDFVEFLREQWQQAGISSHFDV